MCLQTAAGASTRRNKGVKCGSTKIIKQTNSWLFWLIYGYSGLEETFLRKVSFILVAYCKVLVKSSHPSPHSAIISAQQAFKLTMALAFLFFLRTSPVRGMSFPCNPPAKIRLLCQVKSTAHRNKRHGMPYNYPPDF